MVLNHDNLEQLLVTHWPEFLNLRKLMDWCQSTAKEQGAKSPRCTSLTLERCSWTTEGFVIWVTYSLDSQGKNQVLTSEVLLSCDGKLTHIQTI